MKKLLAIALLLSISYQYVAKLGMVAMYELNKDYIARNLCENRDKPQMKCCGKCYLKKQLKKADEQDNGSTQAPSKFEKEVTASFLVTQKITYSFFNTAPLVVFYDGYSFHTGDGAIVSIFHPPPVSC